MTAVDPVSPASPIPGQPARLVTGLGRLLLAVPRPLAPLLPIVWGYLIWTLSSGSIRISGGGFHGMGWFTNLAHAFEFGVLALLCLPLAPRTPERWARLSHPFLIAVLAVTLVWAFLDEAHQSFVPGRDASIWDLGTDLVGIVCTLRVARLAGPRAEARVIRRELWAGLLACVLASGLSTAWGVFVGAGWWPFA
tara:strand:- start:2695 stop:3276 length:582 start_codon:yes stop_codon:yes gene_type:complete